MVIILLLLYKCVLVYSITIYAISAYRVLSRCVLIGETMSNETINFYNSMRGDVKQCNGLCYKCDINFTTCDRFPSGNLED